MAARDHPPPPPRPDPAAMRDVLRDGPGAGPADRPIPGLPVGRWHGTRRVGGDRDVRGRPRPAARLVGHGGRLPAARVRRRPTEAPPPSRRPARRAPRRRAGRRRAHRTQWQELARSLTAYDSLYLRRDDWDTVTTRLVGELGRGTGAAYVRRFEAAARLIHHPAAQRHLSLCTGPLRHGPGRPGRAARAAAAHRGPGHRGQHPGAAHGDRGPPHPPAPGSCLGGGCEARHGPSPRPVCPGSRRTPRPRCADPRRWTRGWTHST